MLYGAVVYRAQQTIHHVLGDLSITKQLSRELSTPVTPYTGNNLIEVISSTITGTTDDTDSNVTDDRSEIETPRADSGGRSDDVSATMERADNKSNFDAEASHSVESKNLDSNSKQTEPNHESKETTNKTTNPPNSTLQTENNGNGSGDNSRISRLAPQISEESVDTPTDSAEGGVTTDETYSTDISEVLRAVYPELPDDIEFVSEDDDTDFTDDIDRDGIDDNDTNIAGDDDQQFFVRFRC